MESDWYFNMAGGSLTAVHRRTTGVGIAIALARVDLCSITGMVFLMNRNRGIFPETE